MVTVPVRCSLKDNIARLPPITDVKAVYVEGLRKGTHSIPAVQGKMASVAIYAHLAAKYGKLTKEAAGRQHVCSHADESEVLVVLIMSCSTLAVEGLGLYAEMVEDAIARPGESRVSTHQIGCSNKESSL
jgi:hypothetical protein